VLIDREAEQQEIRAALASKRAELVIVYGRRGAGKTTLITETLADQPYLYYQATTELLPQQLEDLTAALRTYAPDAVLPGVLTSFDSYLAALVQLARASSQRLLVVVIDELPYLAQADPSVPTVIQRWWDRLRRDGIRNIKVFVLGSLVSWMEEQTLSEHGPLHNRRTGQILVEPLDYAAAAQFYPQFTADERVGAFGIWGGMPSYLTELDPDLPLWTKCSQAAAGPFALSDQHRMSFALRKHINLVLSRLPVCPPASAGLNTALRAAAPQVLPVDHPWRALFSRSGFSMDLHDRAAQPGERLLLFSPEDLYAA